MTLRPNLALCLFLNLFIGLLSTAVSGSYSLVVVHGLLVAVDSPVAEHRL